MKSDCVNDIKSDLMPLIRLIDQSQCLYKAETFVRSFAFNIPTFSNKQ